MSEEGPATMGGKGGCAPAVSDNVNQRDDVPNKPDQKPGLLTMPAKIEATELPSPVGTGTPGPNYFSRKNTSIDVEDYFTGPRDIQKHSKWPFLFRLHGSIMPKMIVPLLGMGAWSTLITLLNVYKVGAIQSDGDLSVKPILLTVLGFVVGLGLSFRSSTAYERYAEGRRYWATLILATQTLGRVFWVHSKDHPNVDRRQSMLRRISCLNLLLAFAISLKHKLRFEPYTGYDDLEHLVAHLQTFARAATEGDPDAARFPRKSFYKEMGEWLGFSFAESNPRKAIKKAKRPLGNLPLEIVMQLSSVVDAMVADEQLPVPMQQTLAYSNITLLNDVAVGTERVLTTPLPIAYGIAINQITWVYVLLLPFQLYSDLKWVTIPATIAASYIILGILFIGKEIENPFGMDVNDLPLDLYCEQIAHELDVIAATEIKREDPWAWAESEANMPLFPVSFASYNLWAGRSEDRLAATIKSKPSVLFDSRKRSSEELAREQAACSNGSLHRRKKESDAQIARGDEQV